MLCNSITLNSAEYWNDYLGKIGYSAKEKRLALPVWAIADIGGAVIGGGSAIIMQWEDINWWKVGANSLWVGAASSGLRFLMK